MPSIENNAVFRMKVASNSNACSIAGDANHRIHEPHDESYPGMEPGVIARCRPVVPTTLLSLCIASTNLRRQSR